MLSAALVFSQDSSAENLLFNGDFEAGFAAREGPEPRIVAEGWTPWHIPAGSNDPAYANLSPNYDQETERLRLDDSGSAQVFFSSFATHHGGILQKVANLESGATYRFSIYGYVWSSSYDDPAVSEDPGDLALRVGIDPKGGIDGTSPDIVWSTAATFFYDAYREYAVIATAESSAITVFVESSIGRPHANNYIYLDDAHLGPVLETNADQPTSPSDPEQDEAQAQAAILDVFDDSVVHEVVEGDTVISLAYQYGSTVEAIRRVNFLDTRSTITIGQELLVPFNLDSVAGEPVLPPALQSPTPSPTATATNTPTPLPTPTATAIRHQVLPGDALSLLAGRYGTTVGALARLNSLFNVHRLEVGQILLIPSPVPPTIVPTTTALPTPLFYFESQPDGTELRYRVYIVQLTDTLIEIAKRFDSSTAEIAALNGIVNTRLITPGQEIRIPAPATPSPLLTQHPPQPPPPPAATAVSLLYFVQEGDTLFGIGARFGVSLVELAQLNDITNYTDIRVGQSLRIPG